ncbi:hypothetical protein DPEC_G00300010 [Dallia pectoralis]|uniref:Uncharacterized protein n=1 Tax=Dallia pectoralis TaxID=75939 RepID=A0ACC2FGM9_DALPE|nr:hypothetical protein DPEC_G00300010 [Dallia pectoralis]
MGQVLGFSHCKEYGSVSSTPDSTPPCIDDGNEESDLYELQTARDWSDQEDEGPEDDEGAASSPSIWGTPRQNSFELTFSYIALAEAEAGGAPRHHRDSLTGSRRRVGARGGRGFLSRTDTVETLLPLDSPDEEWETHPLLLGPDEEEGEVSRQTEAGQTREGNSERVEREVHRRTEIVQPFNIETENQWRTTGPMGAERESPEPGHCSTSASQQESSSAELESPVTMETTIRPLRAAAGPGCICAGDALTLSTSSLSPITQEELKSKTWFPPVDVSEGPLTSVHVAEDSISTGFRVEQGCLRA